MSRLLDHFNDWGYEPVGVTDFTGKNLLLPKTHLLDPQDVKIYLVSKGWFGGSIPNNGRFQQPRYICDKESLLIGLPKRYGYDDRINTAVNHPDGWAGHEYIIVGNLPKREVVDIITRAIDFNIERDHAALVTRINRATNAMQILHEISRRTINL